MSGINYGNIGSTIGQATATKEGELKSFMGTMDPSNTADLIQFQQKTQEWSLVAGIESSSVKILGDALKGIAQKVG